MSALQRLRIARAQREAPVIEPYKREVERGAAMVRQLRAECDALSKIVTSPMARLKLDGARELLVDDLVREALGAARASAEQMAESGDYRVRISIPSLHIERHVSTREMADFRPGSGGDIPTDRPAVRVIDVRSPRFKRGAA